MGKLLVITPTLGRSSYLGATVSSISDLPCEVIHVLVSPRLVVDRLSVDYPGRIVVAEPEDSRSMYAAINQGLGALIDDHSWTHWTYINDDDLLIPDARFWKRALQSLAISYGDVSIIDALGAKIGCLPVSPLPHFNFLLWRNGKTPYTQQGMVVPREISLRHGTFDASYRYVGDMEYWVRLESSYLEFEYHKSEVAAFRVVAGQLSAQRLKFDEEVMRVRGAYGLGVPSFRGKLAGSLFLMFTNPRSYWMHFRRFGFRPRTAMFV